MRFKSFKIGKTGEQSIEETGQKETVTSTEVADMEEKINNKTKRLKDAENQLKGLADSTNSPEGDDDNEIPGPHGPLIELTLEPGDELLDLDTEAELNTLMDTDEKGEVQVINVVEAGNKDIAEADDKSTDKAGDKVADKTEEKDKSEQNEEAKPDKAPQDSGNDFNNLFSDEEEEVNPLSNLINSLPEVSAQELINELEEIKEIIRERQQG
jgi:hypothetical protein